MLDIVLFLLAGASLGGASAWLYGRKPSALLNLAALYAIAVTVCLMIGRASQTEVLAFIAPYALAAIAASLSSAGLLVRWPTHDETAERATG